MRSSYNDLLDSGSGSLADRLARQKEADLEALLVTGWTIKSENGRQVILERDGSSVTRYRPKK